MKLDSRSMRYLNAEDWRVLTAVEIGSKNHEVVPTPLIEKLARVRGGAGTVRQGISTLAKIGLIARVKEARYDGYRLTYGGLDYLALHTHSTRKDIYSVGTRVGVGKESDIMVVADHSGTQCVLKIHRLGRISFRTVKANRDYLRNRSSGSWMYLSRLAAAREYSFMRALYDEGVPVPKPLAQSRHTVLMSMVQGFPLRQIAKIPDPSDLYDEIMGLLLRLAQHGLIHGDYNEFNIMIKDDFAEDGKGGGAPETTEQEENDEEERQQARLEPVIIDFPQMVSMDHPNAEMYFDRDVNCIKRFFRRRFNFVSGKPGPTYRYAKTLVGKDGAKRLDAAEMASGFTKKMAKDLEAAIREQQKENTGGAEGEDDEEDDEDDDDDDDDEDDEGDSDEETDAADLVKAARKEVLIEVPGGTEETEH